VKLENLKTPEEVSAWIQFDEDTEVLIAYVSREDLRKLRRQATVTRYKHHQKVEEVDEKELERLLGRAAVKDWRALPGRPGFTMGDEPYLYSEEHCDFLMERLNEFATFVDMVVVDFSSFVREEKAEERAEVAKK
jgi:hypothetical protein